MQFDGFKQVIFADFEFGRSPGERPAPTSLTLKDRHGGHRVRLEQGDLSGATPPYLVGPESLFVTFDAPAQLGCHLALGWPLPARVLDLQAEFRCQTAGLSAEKGDVIPDALAHFELEGEGVDA